MSYVFEIVEAYVGSKNLIITRENASSLENITSYKPFQESDARGFYDYDFKGRINKVDGLFKLQAISNGENVYTWLLNLEVDGQDKTAELFQCATKMWQAVDVNRAVTSNATTFTLRTNLDVLNTDKFANTKELIDRLVGNENTKRAQKTNAAHDVDKHADIDEIETNDTDVELMESDVGRHERSVLNSEEAIQVQLQIALYILRNFAHSHVYFVVEMLRCVCGKGGLYEHLYKSGLSDSEHLQEFASNPLPNNKQKSQSQKMIYDIHCFLGSFTIHTPSALNLQEMQPSPFKIENAADTGSGPNSIKWDTNHNADAHKKNPVCTVPLILDTSTNMWANWQAVVNKYILNVPAYLYDTPVQFVCVQRVNMSEALQEMKQNVKDNSTDKTTLFPRALNGIWYVQDIIDFLLGIKGQKLKAHRRGITKEEILTWKNFDESTTSAGVENVISDLDFQMWFQHNFPKFVVTASAPKNVQTAYNNLRQKEYSAMRYNALVGNKTNMKVSPQEAIDLYQKKQFYPPEIAMRPDKVKEVHKQHGFFFVLQFIADEMLNSLYSLFSLKMGAATRATSRILWNSKSYQNSIKINQIFKRLKLLRRDVDNNLNDRSMFAFDKSWERTSDTSDLVHVFPHGTQSMSLLASILRSYDQTLPYPDHSMTRYVQTQNIPGALLFIRLLRINNYVAAREFSVQMASNESLKKQFENVMALFPVAVQSELLAFFGRIQHDDTMLAIQIQDALNMVQYSHEKYRLHATTRQILNDNFLFAILQLVNESKNSIGMGEMMRQALDHVSSMPAFQHFQTITHHINQSSLQHYYLQKFKILTQSRITRDLTDVYAKLQKQVYVYETQASFGNNAVQENLRGYIENLFNSSEVKEIRNMAAFIADIIIRIRSGYNLVRTELNLGEHEFDKETIKVLIKELVSKLYMPLAYSQFVAYWILCLAYTGNADNDRRDKPQMVKAQSNGFPVYVTCVGFWCDGCWVLGRIFIVEETREVSPAYETTDNSEIQPVENESSAYETAPMSESFGGPFNKTDLSGPLDWIRGFVPASKTPEPAAQPPAVDSTAANSTPAAQTPAVDSTAANPTSPTSSEAPLPAVVEKVYYTVRLEICDEYGQQWTPDGGISLDIVVPEDEKQKVFDLKCFSSSYNNTFILQYADATQYIILTPPRVEYVKQGTHVVELRTEWEVRKQSIPENPIDVAADTTAKTAKTQPTYLKQNRLQVLPMASMQNCKELPLDGEILSEQLLDSSTSHGASLIAISSSLHIVCESQEVGIVQSHTLKNQLKSDVVAKTVNDDIRSYFKAIQNANPRARCVRRCTPFPNWEADGAYFFCEFSIYTATSMLVFEVTYTNKYTAGRPDEQLSVKFTPHHYYTDISSELAEKIDAAHMQSHAIHGRKQWTVYTLGAEDNKSSADHGIELSDSSNDADNELKTLLLTSLHGSPLQRSRDTFRQGILTLSRKYSKVVQFQFLKIRHYCTEADKKDKKEGSVQNLLKKEWTQHLQLQAKMSDDNMHRQYRDCNLYLTLQKSEKRQNGDSNENPEIRLLTPCFNQVMSYAPTETNHLRTAYRNPMPDDDLLDDLDDAHDEENGIKYENGDLSADFRYMPFDNSDAFERDTEASSVALYDYVCFGPTNPINLTFHRKFLRACLLRQNNAAFAHTMQLACSSWLQMRNTAVQLVGDHYVEQPCHYHSEFPDPDKRYDMKVYTNMRMPLYHETKESQFSADRAVGLSWLAELHAEQSVMTLEKFYHALIDDEKLADYNIVLAFPNIVTQFTSEKWFWTLAAARVFDVWRQYYNQKPKSKKYTDERNENDAWFKPEVLSARALHHRYSQHFFLARALRAYTNADRRHVWTHDHLSPPMMAYHDPVTGNKTRVSYDVGMLMMMREQKYCFFKIDSKTEHAFHTWKSQTPFDFRKQANTQRAAKFTSKVFGDIYVCMLHLRWKYYLLLKTMVADYSSKQRVLDIMSRVKSTDTDKKEEAGQTLSRKEIKTHENAVISAVQWWGERRLQRFMLHTRDAHGEAQNQLMHFTKAIARHTARHFVWKRMLILKMKRFNSEKIMKLYVKKYMSLLTPVDDIVVDDIVMYSQQLSLPTDQGSRLLFSFEDLCDITFEPHVKFSLKSIKDIDTESTAIQEIENSKRSLTEAERQAYFFVRLLFAISMSEQKNQTQALNANDANDASVAGSEKKEFQTIASKMLYKTLQLTIEHKSFEMLR